MMNTCPKCGHVVVNEASACEKCGHALTNGVATQPKKPYQKPPPPPEVANWVIYPVPPEIIEEARRTFNEEEELAALREVEKAGFPELKDLIRELEQEMNSSD